MTTEVKTLNDEVKELVDLMSKFGDKLLNISHNPDTKFREDLMLELAKVAVEFRPTETSLKSWSTILVSDVIVGWQLDNIKEKINSVSTTQ